MFSSWFSTPVFCPFMVHVFCHFNSLFWSSTVISEFYGSLPRYSAECAINPLPSCDHFTRALGWYFAIVELPTGIQTEEGRGGQGEVNINQVCTNKYDECWFPKCSAFCQTPISGEKAVWREWWIIELLPGERARLGTTAIAQKLGFITGLGDTEWKQWYLCQPEWNSIERRLALSLIGKTRSVKPDHAKSYTLA